FAGRVGWDQPDDLSEIKIGVAGVVELEHRVARSRMSIRERPRPRKFHAAVVDISERFSGLRLDQEAQPHRRRKYPMSRLRLRARCFRREGPKHCSVSTVAPDAQPYRAQFVADVAQLPQRLDLRISLGHAFERLATQVELASVRSRPVNPFGYH